MYQDFSCVEHACPRRVPVQPDPAPRFCPAFDSQSRQDTKPIAKVVCVFFSLQKMEVFRRTDRDSFWEKLHNTGEIRK